MVKQNLLDGFNTTITPKMPMMEPVVYGLNKQADIWQRRNEMFIRIGSSVSPNKRYGHINVAAFDSLGKPEYVIPLINKDKKLFAIKVSDADNPYAVSLYSERDKKRGEFRNDAVIAIADMLQEVFPEWNREEEYSIVFRNGKLISENGVPAILFTQCQFVKEVSMGFKKRKRRK